MGEDGFILILTLILLVGILILGFYLSDHLLVQSKIQQNFYYELRTYYLAQAGIEYATSRLAREPDWRAEWLLEHQGSGQIRVQVSEDASRIVVTSQGNYLHYTKELRGFFSKETPHIRLK